MRRHAKLFSQLFPMLLLAASCAGPSASSTNPLAGTYNIGGGDSALTQVQALADAFSATHPGVKFTYDTTLGSDAGVNLTMKGALDLGMASRDLTATESRQVDTILVGVAGTGFAVNQSNPVTELSAVQVRGIYGGDVSDWSTLGGEKLTIIPLIREKGSAARANFETDVFAGKPRYGPSVLEIPSGAEMRKAVVAQRGAIGLIGVHPSAPEGAGVRVLRIDGVAPTGQALRDGTYRLRRPLYLVFARVGGRPAIGAFLDFVRGPEGQKIIDGLL